MEPFRTTGLDLDTVNRRTGSFQCGQRIGLGIENTDRRRIASPETARPFNLRRPAAHTARDAALLIRRITFINARNLEQGDIIETAIRIALGCGQQTRQKRRAHVRHIGSDQVGEASVPACRRQKLWPALLK